MTRKRQQAIARETAAVLDGEERSPVLLLIEAAKWMTSETWKAWTIFLRAVEGDPLAPDEPADTREIFTACTGRSTWPSRRAREVLALIGRGGGKSLMMARMAVAKAVTFERERHPTMAPGEVPIVLVLAADREQGQVCYSYILAALMSDPALARMLVGTPTQERIELLNGVVIQVGTSNFRWVRGRTYLFVVADEAAFWSREHKANPATATLAAIRPGLRFTDSQLCLISTPYAQRDAVFEIYQRYWAHDGDVLVWKAPTAVMNPTMAPAVIDRAREADPIAARSEWDAEFRSDMESFLDRVVVEGLVDLGVRVREWQPGSLIVAFSDPAGGGNNPLADDFTIAFGHPEVDSDGGLLSVIDEVLAIKAPFSPDAAVGTIAEACRRWSVDVIVGDKYGGSWPAASFARYGLAYVPCTSSKSDLYLEALPLFTSGRVRLVDHPRLVTQLINLERRSGRSGKDSVDHPPTAGAHDDLANAVCGCAVLAQTMANDLAASEAQAMSPTEAAGLRAFQSEWGGLPAPWGGLGNLALDDDGHPVDTRYRDDF